MLLMYKTYNLHETSWVWVKSSGWVNPPKGGGIGFQGMSLKTSVG